jgi:gephyrin
MENAKLKAAILIISDTAYKDPSTDKAGSVLGDAFASDGGDQWIVEEKQIVPDDVLSIQRHLMQWCDRDNCMDLIITTGGTGFTAKDNTPEAVIPLLHRQAPGLV